MRLNTKRGTEKDTKAHYRFIRVIGEGAFARVYLAEGGDGQQYACKVSREVKMLRREAEILRGLYHPLFPICMGYEESGGEGRLFMEYIPGRSLDKLVRVRGRLSARQAMRIAWELADGLRYLHERQPVILYRDLKPENIMICENGHIRLVDLGCACYQDIQGGARVGTPGFASPEQLSSEGIAGIYSDIYGLGKTIQNIMMEKRRHHDGGERGYNRKRILCLEEKKYGKGGKCRIKKRKCHIVEPKRFYEEKRCRRRLERMIEETTREDFRQRPQDMAGVAHILAGQRKMEEGIICEKNIWESSYKNSCSLPSI